MQRLTRRRVALGAFFATAVALPAATAWPSLAAQAPGTVTTMAQMSARLTAAEPGDVVTMAAGTYRSGTMKVARSGTPGKPITIRAAQVGATRITGKARIDLA